MLTEGRTGQTQPVSCFIRKMGKTEIKKGGGGLSVSKTVTAEEKNRRPSGLAHWRGKRAARRALLGNIAFVRGRNVGEKERGQTGSVQSLELSFRGYRRAWVGEN